MGYFSARQDGVLGVEVAAPTRFVVGMVDGQGACDLLNGALHPTQQRRAIAVVLPVNFGLNAQGFSLLHLEFEFVVIEGKILT